MSAQEGFLQFDSSRPMRIRRLMEELYVREEDIEEKFIRSQGKGGQNVNKVETCVYLRHRPTGMAVKCQSSRSQNANRLLARELLLEKIRAGRVQRAATQRAEVEKQRRKKRGRSAVGKRILSEQKRRHAQKKKERRKFLSQRDFM